MQTDTLYLQIAEALQFLIWYGHLLPSFKETKDDISRSHCSVIKLGTLYQENVSYP